MKEIIYDLCLFVICLCLMVSTFALLSISSRVKNLDAFVYVNMGDVEKDDVIK